MLKVSSQRLLMRQDVKRAEAGNIIWEKQQQVTCLLQETQEDEG